MTPKELHDELKAAWADDTSHYEIADPDRETILRALSALSGLELATEALMQCRDRFARIEKWVEKNEPQGFGGSCAFDAADDLAAAALKQLEALK